MGQEQAYSKVATRNTTADVCIRVTVSFDEGRFKEGECVKAKVNVLACESDDDSWIPCYYTQAHAGIYFAQGTAAMKYGPVYCAMRVCRQQPTLLKGKRPCVLMWHACSHMQVRAGSKTRVVQCATALAPTKQTIYMTHQMPRHGCCSMFLRKIVLSSTVCRPCLHHQPKLVQHMEGERRTTLLQPP